VVKEDDPLNRECYLLMQGNAIATALAQQGYKVNKLENQIAWEVELPDTDRWLLLTFIPRPVDQWRVLPPARSDQYAEIYEMIERVIGGRK
jgi:hypothetical protein